MEFSKIIEIDIWSSFGCFSKPFSTTGGILSYLIPPKTAIIGMIGSILGYEWDDFIVDGSVKKHKIESLNNIKVSICPLFDLKTKRVTFNHVDGTTEKFKILNISQDVLINPKYKIFIAFPNNLSNEESLFLGNIKKNKTVFSLYMGKNEFPLTVNFIKEHNGYFFNFNSSELKSIKVYGSLNKKNIKSVELTYNDKNSISEDELLADVLDSIIICDNQDGTRSLRSCYEYIINNYPLKRKNFTDFSFSKISFYSTDDFENVYFSNIHLKDDCLLELVNIGDNKWLSLI